MKEIKDIVLILLFLPGLAFPQQTEINLLTTKTLAADQFIGIDKFENTYYIKNNTLFKITENNDETAFQDVLLGDISKVDIINPNKILLFYQMANVVIILDNRLTEIDRQDFNSLSPFKNVSHAGLSKDQNLWIYNIDLNQLELFDYRYDRTLAQSVPVESDILQMKNNFNICFLQTPEGLLLYNIYGSQIKKIQVKGIIAFDVFKNNLIIHSAEGLSLYDQNFDLKSLIKIDFEDYDTLFYKDENLYLYNGKSLSQYKIISKN